MSDEARARAAGYLTPDGTISAAGWDFIGASLEALAENVGNPTSRAAVETTTEIVATARQVCAERDRLEAAGIQLKKGRT